MFFVLAAFGCLVVDRDVSRARLAEARRAAARRRRRARGSASANGGWPAGVLIGLACATKQDAVWYILAFAALSIAWDIGARRAAGLRSFVRGALVRDGKWLPLTFIVIPLATYVATWTSWLFTSTGYDRNYGAAARRHHPGHLRAVLAVRVPPGDDRLRPRAEHPAPVPVPAVGLAA